MIRISSIALILVILTSCADGSDNDNRYLKNGIGAKYSNDKIGPALTIEYSQNFRENIALVPRIFDFGIDGTFQFGKHNFGTVNIYYKFTF